MKLPKHPKKSALKSIKAKDERKNHKETKE